MQYQRLNVILGWATFFVATVVYYLTLEPSMPFWDCGEFIAAAYKLEVGHPPGAPLFMMLGRIMGWLGGSRENVPFMINMLSAIGSAATIMFLFWTITHLGYKIAAKAGEFTSGKMWAVLGSGLVGALAYTFSDTFWFSAVEGEVYALSSLFTAVVFWAILKWESSKNPNSELRWVVLIAYLMGLSIGVHLLSLLTIPAIAFVYFFKNYEVSMKGLVVTAITSLALLVMIQVGVIIWFVQLAGWFERLFVNRMGMPFNSGAIFYFVMIAALLGFGIYRTQKKAKVVANTLLLSIVVAIIGYTSFATIIIRSNANTPMDENNPENIFALLSYLNREQYGDRPLLSGQYFNTPEVRDNYTTKENETYSDGSKVWVKSYSVRDEKRNTLVLSCREPFEADQYIKDHPEEKLKVVEEYIESGEKKATIVNYRKEFSTIFPRMYSDEARHIQDYKSWSNYKNWNDPIQRAKVEEDEMALKELESQVQQIEAYVAQNGELSGEQASQFKSMKRVLDKRYAEMMPSKGEDIRYFLDYQIGWMYFRYFMWNFAGRQDDAQGHGDFLDGNWVSGIEALDEQRLGERSTLPEIERNNKGFNTYFFIPLIIGLIGFIFQATRSTKDFSVIAMLFFLTGLAIVIYLNQTPQQPRERDYAYPGSFYAFCIWIGLGVYALYDTATNPRWKSVGLAAAMSIGGSVLIYFVESASKSAAPFGSSILFMSIVGTALYALFTALSMVKGEGAWKGIAATAVCFTAPFLMGYYNWDDHNRENRRTGIDMAINYLQSLQPNAIIFTNGDNDTFPLWYAQEVENIRTDVRVVNLSLLNTDWYIDQMKRKAYEGEPVPFKVAEQKYRQGTRDVLFLDPYEKTTDYMDLREALNFAYDDSKTVNGSTKPMSYIPSYKLKMKVDSNAAEMFRPFLHEGDSLVTELRWSLTDDRGRPRKYLTKAHLMVLELLANTDWKRPIYFAVTTGGESYMGLEEYFQLEGLAYRLTPIKHAKSPNPNLEGGVATDLMYENMMTKFQWGNMDKLDLYMDENNRRMTTNLRLQFSHLAEQLIEEGKKDSAIAVLNKAMEVMPEKNVTYDQPQIMWHLAELYYDAGDDAKAFELSKRLIELNQQEIDFYNSLDPIRQGALEREIMLRANINDRLVGQAEKRFPDDPMVQELVTRNEEMIRSLGLEPEETQGTPQPTPKDTVQPALPDSRKGPKVTPPVQFDSRGVSPRQ